MQAKPWWVMASAVAGLPVLTTGLNAADAADDLKSFREQIEALEQKVKILERHRELDGEAGADKARTAPSISVGTGGLQVRSADSNFVFKLRGYVQADARFYPDEHFPGAANDTFLLRRVRPIFEGSVFERYDYRVMLDFGSGITSSTANNGFLQDAYLNARVRPWLQFQAGKFKEPVGLERLQSGANLLFVERGYPTQLVPNRDAGLQVHGAIDDGLVSYALGWFNGVADGGSGDAESADDDKDVAARVFVQPLRAAEAAFLRGLGLGLAGTWGHQDGALRTYVSGGQQRFFGYRTGAGTAPATANVSADGVHWRLVPQAYYYWGPFGLFGEYAVSDQELRRDDGTRTFGRVQNTAWQVAASYFITGEENSWTPVAPRHPLNPATGGWGAWEIAGRVGQIRVDDDAFPVFADPATSAHRATSWAVGLNWHLNRNVKLNFNYEQTQFSGGQSPLLDQGEKVFFARAQLSW